MVCAIVVVNLTGESRSGVDHPGVAGTAVLPAAGDRGEEDGTEPILDIQSRYSIYRADTRYTEPILDIQSRYRYSIYRADIRYRADNLHSVDPFFSLLI